MLVLAVLVLVVEVVAVMVVVVVESRSLQKSLDNQYGVFSDSRYGNFTHCLVTLPAWRPGVAKHVGHTTLSSAKNRFSPLLGCTHYDIILH